MASCFYIVLNMSITASAIGLAVLLVRLALRQRLPALAHYALWALVLLRLALPVSLPSPASALNPLGQLMQIVSLPVGQTGLTTTNSIHMAAPEPANAAVHLFDAASRYFPLAMHFKSAAVEILFHTFGMVWLVVAAVVAAVAMALYLVAASRFRRAWSVRDDGLLQACKAQLGMKRNVGLWASDTVASPVVFGLFRPRIIIPKELACDRQTLQFVLLHELVHIRRGDNILRVVSAAVLCIHWFNPLIWLFFRLAGRDMELACDAGVLRRLDRSLHKGYALALAGLAAGRQPILAAAFGAGAVRQRIIGITRYRRLTLAAAVVTVLFLLIVAAVLLSNPVT